MRLRCTELMRGLSLSARLTVATDMPNARAISFIVIGKFSAIDFCYAAKLTIIFECCSAILHNNIKTKCKRLH